jgi:sulfite exporter TauE/SafE
MDHSHHLMLPEAATLGTVFVFSLFASVHCIGMCGPLLALAEGLRPGKWTPWSQLPMHAGRIVTYALLGLVAGLVGGLVDHAGIAAGVRGAASLLGGAAMVLFAVVLLGWFPWRRPLTVSEGFVGRFSRRLASRHPLGGVVLGLYWGLLPCGLVWAALLCAGATGSALRGALVMVAFGAGTVPALLLAGGLGGLVGPRLRGMLPRVAAASVMALGLLLVLRGAAGAGWIPHMMISEKVPLF